MSTKLFTVDRWRRFSPGMRITLTPPDYAELRRANIRLDPGLLAKQFRDGLSMHGQRYLINWSVSQKGSLLVGDTPQPLIFSAPAIELVFELVRLVEFQNSFSRFQSFFGCRDLSELKKFADKFNFPRNRLRTWKPEAEKFTDWVTGEVLPQIRKTGRYSKDVSPWLSSDPSQWRKTFPDAYFLQICRLKGKRPPKDGNLKYTPWLAHINNDLIYKRLDVGVLEALNLLNPLNGRYRARKQHQYIAPLECIKDLVADRFGFINHARARSSNHLRRRATRRRV
jgi:P63C domain